MTLIGATRIGNLLVIKIQLGEEKSKYTLSWHFDAVWHFYYLNIKTLINDLIILFSHIWSEKSPKQPEKCG